MRAALAGAAVVGLLAMIGLGSAIASLAAPRDGMGPAPVAQVPATPASPEVAVLRGQVEQLRDALDTLRTQEARLQAEIGVPLADTATLMRRLLSSVPRWLRGPARNSGGRRPRGEVASMSIPAPYDSLGMARFATGAGGSADSLTRHALELAAGYRRLAPRELFSLDTLDVLHLQPESLKVAVRSQRATRSGGGRAVDWAPRRAGVVLAGFDGEVSRSASPRPGVWELETRARGGLVGRLVASGTPVVRVGAPVRTGQALMLIATDSETARYELRRNGVPLDPTR